jgi:nicotinate dehydrogenase subunit A
MPLNDGDMRRDREGVAMAISLKVNGATRSVPAEPDTPLLYVLRNDFELNGAKFGCGLAQCGSCTVLIDGKAVRSCVTDIGSLANAEITTLEGLGTIEKPHALQRAFIEEQAAQCGYCINGMIMSAKALLDRNPKPTESDVRQALAANLCRCGTHNRIVRAVLRAANEMGRT